LNAERGSNERLLEGVKRAAAGGDNLTSINPSSRSYVFAEHPNNWSAQNRPLAVGGGGFVHFKEGVGSAQNAGSGGSFTSTREGRDRALIEMPWQPLADAEPWWVHLDNLSGGGLEAETAKRLRTEIGRPRRDPFGTRTPDSLDSLDTPPQTPLESPTQAQLSISQLEARVRVLGSGPPTFVTATKDVLLDSQCEVRVEIPGKSAQPSTAPLSTGAAKVKSAFTTTRRPKAASSRPQSSISSGAHRVTRYEKYMSEMVFRDSDSPYNTANHSAKTTSNTNVGVVISGSANVLFEPGASKHESASGARTQRRGWCDRSRLSSSHRRVQERQVTIVEAEAQKPCAGWGWGSRAPTEQATGASCSLPVLGNQSARDLVSARNGGEISSASVSWSQPVASQVSVVDAVTSCSFIANRSRSSASAQVGQAWRAPPPRAMKAVHHGSAGISIAFNPNGSHAAASVMHSRGGWDGGTLSHKGNSIIDPLAASRKGEGEALSFGRESAGGRERGENFFMDGHPSMW